MAKVKRNEKPEPKEENEELQDDPFPGSVKDELTGKYRLPETSD